MNNEIIFDNLKDINPANVMLYPFPEITDVFTGDLAKDELIFLPLCSIDLGNGQRFHIVSPWAIGDGDSFYDDKALHYLMRFKTINNKYEFNGDYEAFPRFDELGNWRQEALKEFAIHKNDYMTPKSSDEYYQGEKNKRDDARSKEDFEHHSYHDSLISYLIGKECFRNTSKLVSAAYYTDGYGYRENNFLDRFGDQPEWAQDMGELSSQNGAPLIFIAQLTGYTYHKNAPDSIYLFYDESAQEVIHLFQWT